MKALAAAMLCVLAAGASRAADGDTVQPELSKERVVFHTIGGDFVFALYPKVAPKTCEAFLAMVRAGAYDSTHFHRLHPGFVLQNAGTNDRQFLLLDKQREVIHKLTAEFSDVPHVRRVLSMAREDNDINSGESSFSILLGDAPHLNGKYTVFGEVVQGMEVVDEFLKVPRDPVSYRPKTRLTVKTAEVADTPQDLAAIKLVGPTPVAFEAEPEPEKKGDAGMAQYVPAFAGVIIALLLLVSVAQWALAEKIPPAKLASIQLISVLVGSFFAVTLLTPAAQHQEYLAILVFFGILGLFKLMGRFEASAPPPKKPEESKKPA